MNENTLLEKLIQINNEKIVLLVMDGVGDIASKNYGMKSALEYAITPNMDKLAKAGVCGRHIPVAHGITPGSGPAHLGLFGYDPLEFEIGRGILEAAGLDMDVHDGDLAVRCNFATADEKGVITDRRAGRISTELCEELCALLSEKIKEIDKVQIFIKPSMQHRFVVLFRAERLSAAVTDSDPLSVGSEPLEVRPLHEGAEFTARVVNKFFQEVRKLIKNKEITNSILMRGFSQKPNFRSMHDRFKLNPVCIAHYPMYRGLSKLVGMNIATTGKTPEEEFKTYLEMHAKYDFFFIHIKYTDSFGEDGNFEEKVKMIETVDAALPILMEKMPNVLCITGDHSTPAAMKGHSWHPVPVLIHGDFCGGDDASRFTENECNKGGLGMFESKYLINYLLANARKLNKFGA